mmetsp:Transcript_11689/g.19868  ORF Transcript_11689/g.19868 Transcript_11689/m.19868 type:complete len:295 (+) Transcript_11689:36-920(+)
MLAFAKQSIRSNIPAQTRGTQPPPGAQPPSTPTEHQTEEQWTEESLKALKNDELKAILQGLGLKRSGNKKELVDRILGREVVTENKKKPKWRNSKARAMLVRMLMDNQSNVHKMTWKESHASHEWFQEYDPMLFQRYVRDLRKANPQKVAVVTEDNEIIKRELNRFPRPTKTNRGEPFWDTHPAKLLLRGDVKAGKHLDMKPALLHQTRSEYKAFSLKTFRAHIYQEKRHQKELPMRVNRRNKKAQYKYEKEVKENVALWNTQNDDEDNEDDESVEVWEECCHDDVSEDGDEEE